MYEVFKLEDPRLDSANLGCIPWAEAVMILEETVKDAQSQGGMCTIGGYRNTDETGNGRFFEPTIIANANCGMKLQMRQNFGPIVGVQSVDSTSEVSSIIN